MQETEETEEQERLSYQQVQDKRGATEQARRGVSGRGSVPSLSQVVSASHPGASSPELLRMRRPGCREQFWEWASLATCLRPGRPQNAY